MIKMLTSPLAINIYKYIFLHGYFTFCVPPYKVHVSDWLPTFLQAAGEPELTKGLKLDGVPLLEGLRTGVQVRSSVLLDLYTATDSHDGGALVAYRKGDFKVDIVEIFKVSQRAC